jgi:hypothetical protein
MNRRPLGRGRRLAALAAAVIVVGCFLPWWQFGGADGLPPTGGNAFEGAGIVPFFAALGIFALLALPYAAGDRPVGFDRTLTYGLLLVVAWAGFLVRFVDLVLNSAYAPPDRWPPLGIWVVLLGLLGLSRAVYEMASESARR